MSPEENAQEEGEQSLEARVLVVDDEENQRLLIRHILESAGYIVDEAETAEDASTKLKPLEEKAPSPYDVAVIDFRLPGKKDGIDLLSEMNKEGIETEAIIVSGYIDKENVREAFKEGAYDIIEKGHGFREALLEAVPKAVKEKHDWDSYVRKVGERTSTPDMPKRVQDEQYYTAQGSGGRRKEEISRQEALRRMLMDKVLIFHDDDEKRTELESRLKREFNVVTARDLSDAKRILPGEPSEVKLIMMDSLLGRTYNSKDMMGFELTKELKATYPKIPVILTYGDSRLDLSDLRKKATDAGADAYVMVADDLENRLNEVLDKAREKTVKARRTKKSKKTKHRPYVLVLVGPTCSGKTTTALDVERILNERGEPTVYIGNIKTGEPRKGEIRKGRDKYVSEEKADELENDPNFTKYTFLGRRHLRYFSKDSEILEALREDKNVILVRNVEGLKMAGELVYKHKDRFNARLISYRLHAGEDTLRQRLDERVDKARITPEEYSEREETLRKTIVEHASAPCDRVVSTSQPEEKTQQEVIGFMNWFDEHHPDLHLEFSNYARDMMRKLTNDRFYTRKEFQRELSRAPIIIDIESKILPYIEIVRAEGHNGVYTFYFNPFYSKKDFAPKHAFLHYLERLLDEKAERSNLLYEPDPASGYAKTRVSYLNNKPIRLDDIALFTLRKGISAEFAGDEYHTVAFVCLEDKPSGEIKVTEI